MNIKTINYLFDRGLLPAEIFFDLPISRFLKKLYQLNPDLIVGLELYGESIFNILRGLSRPAMCSSETALWMEAVPPKLQGRVFAANSLVLELVGAIAALIAPIIERSPSRTSNAVRDYFKFAVCAYFW